MPAEIEIKGLDKVINKMQKFPGMLQSELRATMKKSLLVLQENVPSYPRRPEKTSYVRTGTLGRSLGVSEGGGKAGEPTVYSITGSGKNIEGRFGSDLVYAKYVIDPDRQAYMHRGRWWTMENIANAARDKIIRVWDSMIRKLLNRL